LNVLVSDIAQTLPLDDISRAEALVWSEFTARAAFNPRLAQILLEVDKEISRDLETTLQDRQKAELLDQHLDITTSVTLILALADGIAMRMLYDPSMDAALARTVIEYALVQILGKAE